MSFSLREGHIHAVIGPNGAGKTTFFNLLTKFLSPTSGQIYYKGEDITGLKSAEIARRGVVRSFQISATFPHLTVLENIRIALQRKLGTALHFWRSEDSLHVLDARAASSWQRSASSSCRPQGRRAAVRPQAGAGNRHHHRP